MVKKAEGIVKRLADEEVREREFWAVCLEIDKRFNFIGTLSNLPRHLFDSILDPFGLLPLLSFLCNSSQPLTQYYLFHSTETASTTTIGHWTAGWCNVLAVIIKSLHVIGEETEFYRQLTNLYGLSN